MTLHKCNILLYFGIEIEHVEEGMATERERRYRNNCMPVCGWSSKHVTCPQKDSNINDCHVHRVLMASIGLSLTLPKLNLTTSKDKFY